MARSDGAGTGGSRARSSGEYETQDAPIDSENRPASFSSDDNVLSEGDRLTDNEGESSDSDALLPVLSRPLSTPERPKEGDKEKKQTTSSSSDIDSYLNDCSPLLRSIQGNHTEVQVPRLSDEINDPGTSISASTDSIGERSETLQDPPNFGLDTHVKYGSGSDTSSSIRRRSPSPRTLVSNRQEYASIAPISLNFDTAGSVSSASLSARSHASQNSEHASASSRSLPPAAVLRPGSPSITSSAPSSQSNGSLQEQESRLKSLRRFVRKRGSKKAHQTDEESNQDQTQTPTQSLGDEDLFALSINGADPRRPVHSENTYSQHQQHMLQQHQQQMVAETLPPVVWEESSSSESEQEELTDGRRPRALSEPSGGRLRGFLFPRSTAPGVRRRGSRQSRSVRRRLPRSTSSSGASRAAPLSTTAAAVLFTSSQSQVSVDSSHEHDSFSLRQRQPSQRQSHPHSQQGPLHSTSILDDSARGNIGMSTVVDRSSIADTGMGDAASISTIGNSTTVRSDLSFLRGDGSAGQHSGATHSRLQQQPRRQTGMPESGDDSDGSASDLDPSREARVRWVRINQRFQLMVTFVAVLFSLLLFGILLSWIVLTSAYVITFERTCDVPLKFFYFLATIQLMLDVFRNDIMRRILLWDPSSHGSTQQAIPARVVAYNIAYMAYALLVLRIGITSVYVDGQQPESTCRLTAPELFNSSFVYVTLTLLAWATIILGYLIPFCVVAVLLTWNGYNPGESAIEARVTAGPGHGGVFSGSSGLNAAPPDCIEKMHHVHLGELGENCPQECCICMEDFQMADSIVQTDCGHVLHKNCCSVWLRQARTCPVCRADIPNAQQERMRNINQGQSQIPEALGRQESNQDIEQQINEQPRQHDNQIRRPRVQLNSPRLPFRPGGREEVETIIRAIRQAGTQRSHRNDSNQASGSIRRSASSRNDHSLRSSRNEAHRHSGEAANTATIEIARLGRQSD